jgi:hypothetical protein
MAVPYTFATATTSIPLSQLDSNFATTITLGNTAIQLGNTVTTLNNMTLANVTISTGNVTVTSASLSGNLTFTGTGNRITGDFSNATAASRVAFQSSTTNGNSTFTVLPNGTATASSLSLESDSAVANGAFFVFTSGANSNTEARLNASIRGTGTYLPMTFYTGGSERIRIDTSGNVGVGVTPSAWGSAYKPLQINAQSALWGTTDSTFLSTNEYVDSAGQPRYIQTGAATRYRQDGGSHIWSYVASGTAGNAITYTQAMTLNASGNLGIGATPGTILDVYKASGNPYFRVYTGTGSVQGYMQAVDSTYVKMGALSNHDLGLVTNGTERMRIDSSGTVMVNSTAQVDSSKFQVVGATQSNNLIVVQDTGTVYGTSQFYQKFLNSSAAVAGSIQHTAVTTVAFSTTSDGRLKEDKGVATDMSVIDNTVIHNFVWKLDGLVDRGIFAQEAHLIKPTAISVGNDELTEDGNLRNPWGVDYSKYVPDLIVYCQQLKKITQEQQATINALTARIVALETK